MERHEACLAHREDARGEDRSCCGLPACCGTVTGGLGC